ncbi:Asp-tRNA(Asn)/Glu-tRNA(Gln) amidotransferase GatCAB subunit B [Candidatus Saccharibacteria bacterium]|nr:MAG: Asp-tRNA(Asn)/Glu-tRNA(Gln) amidotransferase GatCAB subunit B [Candidatus Saccharibacteria bacterium]
MSSKTADAYRATIGIECHVQLATKTKLFAAVDNDAREAAANTLVSHICFGLPGALPVLNEAAVHLAAKAAFALGTRPQPFSKFDRKHYFYPDLPMGYQITQFDEPIILGGSIDIVVDDERKTIGVTRAHLEADAGKSTHPSGADYSLVDLNRAGTPLLEIVSEPDMHTAAEAKAYARELWLAMKYAGVSDCNLYYGNMRFDVNVSVSKTDELGTRTETKNINSFRSVEKAVEYEIKRQIDELEHGRSIVQETRGWDDAKLKTFSQRTKEDAHDYRYFPDPDLPPIVLDEAFIEDIAAEMPISPVQWRKTLHGIGLDAAAVETLLDAEVENERISYLPLIQESIEDRLFVKTMANWFINIEIPHRRATEERLGDLKDAERVQLYQALHDLTQRNLLSSTNAKQLLLDVLAMDALPEDIAHYAEEKGYLQVSDESEILAIVDQVIADNPKAADDVRAGEMKVIGFLVGQVMKQSKGRANPQLAQQLLRQQLGL